MIRCYSVSICSPCPTMTKLITFRPAQSHPKSFSSGTHEEMSPQQTVRTIHSQSFALPSLTFMLSYSGQLLRIRSRAVWARPTYWTRQVRLLLIFTHRVFSLTQPAELTKSSTVILSIGVIPTLHNDIIQTSSIASSHKVYLHRARHTRLPIVLCRKHGRDS